MHALLLLYYTASIILYTHTTTVTGRVTLPTILLTTMRKQKVKTGEGVRSGDGIRR